jgi:predicted nucleic-acid-binding protein
MIGLDTNIVVRYLTQDDPVQSKQATDIFERQLNDEAPGFISIVAMVETAWVLERAYRLGSEEIATAIERLLQADTLMIENEQIVFSAMTALKDRLGSFSDSVIAALGTEAGCTHTLTFDRKAARLPGFRAP